MHKLSSTSLFNIERIQGVIAHKQFIEIEVSE